MDTAVSLTDITKRFDDVVANDEVDMQVERGTVHALLGENGAGKTTLMNVLYGLYRPTAGEVYVDGDRAEFDSPQDAIAAGVGMIHQHFMLVEPMTVRENIALGWEPVTHGGLKTDDARIDTEVRELSERYGLGLAGDLDTPVEQLSMGARQRVEVLKALYRGADVFIFDEPTAVLTPQEVEELFDIFSQLTAQDKTIIFITHKLGEALTAADGITVLRDGERVGTVDADADAGTVRFDGEAVTGLSRRERLDRGLAHVPGDRQEQALVMEFDLVQNAVLGSQHRPPFGRRGRIDWGAAREHAEAVIEEYDVRPPNPDLPARSLSGGNQQKFVVGRELSREPDVVVAAHPTRGVDIGSKEFIHERLLAMREQGAAVLVVSASLDEVVQLSDRIAVMYEGSFVDVVPGDAATEEQLGLLMAGEQPDEPVPTGAGR